MDLGRKPPHSSKSNEIALPCAQPSENSDPIFELKRSKILGKIIKKVKATYASVVCNVTLLLFVIQIYLSSVSVIEVNDNHQHPINGGAIDAFKD